MTEAATEAELANLPPAQRRTRLVRIGELSDTSRLLGSTAIAA